MKNRPFILLLSLLMINNLIAQNLKYNNEPSKPFVGLKNSSIAIGKVNNDNYYDILVSGELESGEWVTKLYLNNSDKPGSFIEYTSQEFNSQTNSKVELIDLNDDKSLDIVVCGVEGVFIYYSNKKGNKFNKYKIESNAESYRFVDLDNDNDLDIIAYTSPSTKSIQRPIFSSIINNGKGEFNYKDFHLSGYSQIRDLEIADINSDGFDDLVLLATKDKTVLDRGHTIYLYLYDKNGGFVEYQNPNYEFETIWKGKLEVVDNYLRPTIKDILVTGQVDDKPVTILYTNEGHGNFSTKPYFEPGGVLNGKITSGDFDHKYGDDFLFIGDYETTVYLSSVNSQYRFIKSNKHPFDKIVKHGSVVVEDLNGDYLEDVLIMGLDASNNYFSKIYFCDE